MAINTPDNTQLEHITPEQIAEQERLLNALRQRAAGEVLTEKENSVKRTFATEAEKSAKADQVAQIVKPSLKPESISPDVAEPDSDVVVKMIKKLENTPPEKRIDELNSLISNRALSGYDATRILEGINDMDKAA